MKSVSLLLLILVYNHSFSQNIQGQVINGSDNFGLVDVQIINADSTFHLKTDISGNFYLPRPDTYIFSKTNFRSQIKYLGGSKFHVIELNSLEETLNEIIVTSNNFATKLKDLPSAISVITESEISSQNNINISPIINSISGIYMHNGTLTTNRITIRGIGSRNLFGTSKIRAYFENIPLTNGSGISTIEDLEMGTLGRMEILKGPSSSIYGAGLGGTIHLIPSKGLFNKSFVQTTLTLGSYGLKKYLVQALISDEKNKAKITYSNLHSDGYRENNETNRHSVTIASEHFINSFNNLTFLGNFTDLKAFIPSSLSKDDYLNNPTAAAFTWGRSQGFEDYQKGLFGVSWDHIYTNKTKQITSIFTSFLNSYEPRPFNVLEEKTTGIGIRTKLISKTKLFNNKLNWTIGGELFKDVNSFQTYKNLYNDFPTEVGSVKGNLLTDLKEQRQYLNLFFDSNYVLSKVFQASIGFNINMTSYTLEDNLINGAEDFSGGYNFNTILSPKLGLTYQLSANTMIYSSLSHGFSPPTLQETLLPDGLINTSIKPESGWNYEIGSRGNFFNKLLNYDIAIYKMTVKDLLVARRTSDDQFIGVNAGKTIYNGVELSLNYTLFTSDNLTLNTRNALTLNDFKFDTFIDNTENYSGNNLTGVPKFTYNSTLNFDTRQGLYGLINFTNTGEIPIRDDNTIYADNYQLLNAKIGYHSSGSKMFVFDIFLGFNNIFNEKYASMLLINAGSFGGNAPRYYYPGEPDNYYAGVNITCNFK